MDITTFLGSKFEIPLFGEIIFILVIFIFVIILRNYLSLNKRKAYIYQLFIFKKKQLGLSNFQSKILNSIVTSLSLKDPNELLQSCELFESAIGNFINYLNRQGENKETIFSICKDVIQLYEKLYFYSSPEKSLVRMFNFEENQLLYFTTEDEKIFIGKVLHKNSNNNFSIKLFVNSKTIQKFRVHLPITVYLWRKGDIENIFNSYVTNINNKFLDIFMPVDFVGISHLCKPNIDVIIQCSVSNITRSIINLNEEPHEIIADIFKLNKDEVVLRTREKLECKDEYSLSFQLMNYNIKILSKIISNQIKKKGNIFYYTFQFLKMSKSARGEINKYIVQHL